MKFMESFDPNPTRPNSIFGYDVRTGTGKKTVTGSVVISYKSKLKRLSVPEMIGICFNWIAILTLLLL